MSDFKFQIDRLSEKPERLRFEASPEWWRAREVPSEGEAHRSECELKQAFVFSLELTRVRENVRVEGNLEAEVDLPCSRCGKRYSHPLRESFRLVLEPAKGREPGDLEGVQALAGNGLWLGEDLEAGWFRGPVIQLDDFFGEVIAMTMPLQPLCHEDCAGICSHCGVDLGGLGCDCVDERIASPFAVLARLKGETKKN